MVYLVREGVLGDLPSVRGGFSRRPEMRTLRLAVSALALPLEAAHGMRLSSFPRGARLRGGYASMSSAVQYDFETDFEHLKTEYVRERALTTSLYRHKATGAEVLSVDADDDNKVFSCNFRTLPKDDTGVPHILEHSVLCGSRKYPVKEPFVEMLKGSLKTFLNAMTAADKTMYPVASQNKRDFLNLVNVYLDACLYPRILDPQVGPQILKQEGWHYEVDDPEAPLTFKGVVFNEMKGVYSSADQVRTSARACAWVTRRPPTGASLAALALARPPPLATAAGAGPLPRPQEGPVPRPPDLRDRLGRRPDGDPVAELRGLFQLPPDVLSP